MGAEELASSQQVVEEVLEGGPTEFAKRNPLLASFIPDFMENAVDAMIPDALEAKMEKRAQSTAGVWRAGAGGGHSLMALVTGALMRPPGGLSTRKALDVHS